LKQLYGADGIADSVDFKFHGAVKLDKGSPFYDCPDEDDSCPSSQWVLCAMSATNTTMDEKISFLTCFDADQSRDPQKKTETCAATVKLDFKPIVDCHGGSLNKTLMDAAVAENAARFPHHWWQPFGAGVPDIRVNGVDVVKQFKSRNYTVLLGALCATGIKAGACNHTEIVV